jgi:hypothetical protein
MENLLKELILFFRDNYDNNIIGEDRLRDFENVVVNNLHAKAENILYELQHSMTKEKLAYNVVDYFETHSLDEAGMKLYLQAEKILGDIIVTPNI